MPRVSIPEAEELLDKPIPCLDKGFVRMVDYMGGDARIVQSARVSYGEGTKTVREDKGLINYLMKNDHTSPFEQVSFTFHCKMPVFVARQWVRHRTARLNEISGRYSVLQDEFYVPEADQIRLQSKTNKQGRSAQTVDPNPEKEGAGKQLTLSFAKAIVESITAEQQEVYENYKGMIDDGLARELARINLPVSLYTEWYWSIDLHNLFHFIQLRADAHAQYEIRVYAEALATCAQAVAPLAYEAFEEHRLHAVKFSRTERCALAAMLKGKEPEMDEKALKAFLAKTKAL
jgi:thymidylate synthase (FAD)